MTNQDKGALWAKIKTMLLALVLTFLFMAIIIGNNSEKKKILPKNQRTEQRIAKLESALRENRELLRETREANRTLREMLSELRGIHNDCQRNTTDSFLREHRNNSAR